MQDLIWKKYPVLNDGFICLVDHMGDDYAIVQAARVSYGKDVCLICNTSSGFVNNSFQCSADWHKEQPKKDRSLIRRLMMDHHTSPFEMVEFKFKVRVPMDCWRQWIRHRTANVNEYSTRYSEAIDSQQTTLPEEWRLQAKDNKQGSSGFLEDWPKGTTFEPVAFDNHMGHNAILPNGDEIHDVNPNRSPGEYLSHEEDFIQDRVRIAYEERLALGIAREQARKDLPLSTYTEAYWKCDLHNIFNFLRLRLDSHAQLEIRLYAQAMYEIVKQVCPVACEAFEDYVLQAKTFSRIEIEVLNSNFNLNDADWIKPSSMTDNEWKEFLGKLT